MAALVFSSGPGHGLLPGLGVRGDGASVRGLRGARGPLLQLLQRPAGVQREVVQEWEGVLQLSPGQSQSHHHPQPARHQRGAVQVQHELRDPLPPLPGQHWPVSL